MSHLKEYVSRVAASTDGFEDFQEQVRANKSGQARLNVLTSDECPTRYGLMFAKLDGDACVHPIEREAVGAIFDRDTHELLCRTHPLMHEFVYDGSDASWREVLSTVPGDLGDYVVRTYMEGTRMMVYQHRGEWCVSTCRVLDARQGRWLQGSSTFWDQWEGARQSVGLAWEDLDPRCAYTFLVCSPDTAAVTPFTVPYLFLLGVMDRETGEFVPPSDEQTARLPVPTPIAARSVEDVRIYLDATSQSVPGVVATHVRTGTSYKILHGKYVAARQLLGNTTSMLRRILELLNGPVERVKEFERTFPHLREEVRRTRQRLYNASRWLMDVYRARYIRKCAPTPTTGDPTTFLPKPVHTFLVDLYVARRTHRDNYSPAMIRHLLLRLPSTMSERILELSESSAALYDLSGLRPEEA